MVLLLLMAFNMALLLMMTSLQYGAVTDLQLSWSRVSFASAAGCLDHSCPSSLSMLRLPLSVRVLDVVADVVFQLHLEGRMS